jgi:hypothetical protein
MKDRLMSVSSITTYGSAAIASPPAGTTNTSNPKPDDNRAEASPAQQVIEAAKDAGTGQFVDKRV